MKVLYIGKKITNPVSGADQVNFRNQKLLEQIVESGVDYFFEDSKGGIGKYCFGVSKSFIDMLKHYLAANEYDCVFVSQSLYGRAVKFLKKKYPRILIMTFFHNIELDYALKYLKTSGFRALPFLCAVKIWEKETCLYSDVIITLNNRDSMLLDKIYNRKSDLELPTSFDDKFDECKAISVLNSNSLTIDYLFVGVAFFANIQAVQWFIDEVLSFVPGHFYVIGKGMDSSLFNNLTDRVHILGFVNDLSFYYYRAKVIVSPIKIGGGMKTKTAEALMYGKTILGSQEAFEGYVENCQSMIVCKTSKDYISAIRNLSSNFNPHNECSREIYKNNYSNAIALAKLRTLFNLLKNGKTNV